MNVLLFTIAYILLLPLTVVNYFLVKEKGYFKDSAINLDKFGNREFRTLFNKTLILEGGYKFGDERETISSALGKNQQANTLSTVGKVICFILDTIDKDHCKKSIKPL